MRDPKLAHILVKIDPLDEPKKTTEQKVLSFQEIGQKRKMVINISLSCSSALDCTIFPFKKDLKSKYVPEHSSLVITMSLKNRCRIVKLSCTKYKLRNGKQ